MITFFGAYVPYIGATVAGFVAVLLAVGDGGLDRGLAMLSVVLAVQVLEGNVLQPWIQGKAVELHPLVIALAITAGGALAGFLGVFLAVPVTAAGVVALSELRAAGVVGDPRVLLRPAALQRRRRLSPVTRSGSSAASAVAAAGAAGVGGAVGAVGNGWFAGTRRHLAGWRSPAGRRPGPRRSRARPTRERVLLLRQLLGRGIGSGPSRPGLVLLLTQLVPEPAHQAVEQRGPRSGR